MPKTEWLMKLWGGGVGVGDGRDSTGGENN